MYCQGISHDGDVTGQESALLVLVPAAGPVAGPHRTRLDLSARDGVPAHLTVPYPFLPPERIGPEELAALARLFAAFPASGFTLDRAGWFGDAVAWPGPGDEAPFRALTGLASAAYPSCPPCGGAREDVVPHLTTGHLGGPDVLGLPARRLLRLRRNPCPGRLLPFRPGWRRGRRPLTG